LTERLRFLEGGFGLQSRQVLRQLLNAKSYHTILGERSGVDVVFLYSQRYLGLGRKS
jgi:hypothetical protein